MPGFECTVARRERTESADNAFQPVLLNNRADTQERCDYVIEFFRRHVHKGTTVTSIQGHECLRIGAEDELVWVDVTHSTFWGSTIDRDRGDPILSFQTEFMRSNNCVVYLAFKHGRLMYEPVTQSEISREALGHGPESQE